MKFRKSGVHDPLALESKRNIQPIEHAKLSQFTRLNCLLGFVKKFYPEVLEEYTTNLQRRYDSLATTTYVQRSTFDIVSLISEFDSLKEFPDLALSNLNYLFQILQLPANVDLENDSFEITQRIQLQAVLYHKYQNLFSLANTIDRNEAIELYKAYHDEFMRMTTSTQKDRFDNLEELAEQWFQEDTISSPGLIRYVSEVKDGKLFLRKDTCLWNDAIEELEDKELKYVICCYGDYGAAKRDNKHFVMTMKHTIIEGHNYCDCVYHDTRVSTDLTHPSDDFFASIETESN